MTLANLAAVALMFVCAAFGWGACEVLRVVGRSLRKAWAHSIRGGDYDGYELLDGLFIFSMLLLIAAAGLLAILAAVFGAAALNQT